jgi:hypothetical protein
MTKDEIKEYRKTLGKAFSDRDQEIETTLSYITIGALGFFLTINEKFLKLQEANYKIMIIISLVFLFLAFVLMLRRKSRIIHHSMKMMKFADHMKPDTTEDDVNLFKLWQNSHKELLAIRKVVYLSLVLGIGLQILFFFMNIKI